jgi:uncharacterized membrane protein YeaQ/YmgE (transglycosylase-associated protein family)
MMHALKSIKNYVKRTDKLYWFLMFIISGYSLLLMKTIPNPEGRTLGYFTTMLVAVVGGFIGAVLFSLIDYREISNYWYVVAGFCLFLIIYTLLFGSAVVNSGGVNAKAWISLPGGLTFQPSELVKIGFILTFSKHRLYCHSFIAPFLPSTHASYCQKINRFVGQQHLHGLFRHDCGAIHFQFGYVSGFTPCHGCDAPVF